MPFKVIDLTVDPAAGHLLIKFKSFIKEHCSQDLLYNNYINLDLNDFICVTAVIDNDTIIALSGVQHKPERWGPNTVRMSTRFWMHPKYRINALSKYDPAQRFYFNSQLMIPYQLVYLKTLGIKFAIITREGNYRRSFTKFIELVNYYNNTNFIVLNGMFNVCNHMSIVPESCQQIVAVHAFDNSLFDQELTKLHQENKLILLRG
jgi:hypothetical protein